MPHQKPEKTCHLCIMQIIVVEIKQMTPISGPTPHSYKVTHTLTVNGPNEWLIEWRPLQLGMHTIDVWYGNMAIAGSPFKCSVYDLSKVYIVRDESLAGVDIDGIPGEDIVLYGNFVFTSFYYTYIYIYLYIYIYI